MIVTEGNTENFAEKGNEPKGLSLFSFLLDTQLNIREINFQAKGSKQQIKIGEHFRHALEKIIMPEFGSAIYQIFSAAEHCATFQKEVILDKQIIRTSNESSQFCCRSRFLPFFVDGKINSILVTFDDILVLKHQESLEKVFKLEEKVFESSVNGSSINEPLRYIIQNLENYSSDMLCFLLLFEGEKVQTIISSALPPKTLEPFYGLSPDSLNTGKDLSYYDLKGIKSNGNLSEFSTILRKTDGKTLWFKPVCGAGKSFLSMLVCIHKSHSFPFPPEKEVFERSAGLCALVIENYLSKKLLSERRS